MNIHTVIFPSRPQIDTICAFFILSKYGQEEFPGIENAEVKVSTVPSTATHGEFLFLDNTLLLDCNESILDHHNKKDTCLTELVISYLKLEKKAELNKIKQFAKRDDLFGKGIISKDSLDRAFGLPGILANLNKMHPNEPNIIFRYILPLVAAHHSEEMRREYEMPAEIILAKENNVFTEFFCEQRGVKLKCCIINSNNVSIGGYLRSTLGGSYDVVLQIRTTGNIVILTKNKERVSIRGLALVIRLEELISRESVLNLTVSELLETGTIPEVPEWYYDTATNSLFNGNSNTSISASNIDKKRLQEILTLGLSEKMLLN